MQYLPLLKATASVAALSALLSPAFAQSQDQKKTQDTVEPQTVETVVVSGVRASLASAQTVKKMASTMVDSIVAEDIGKLPDNNVVEALQHVSGVQVIHSSGEASSLMIHGLPDIATTLNGREIFTTTGRYVALADLPAELLSEVNVEKSAEAKNLEGGIAGTIDIRLHRPFDFDGFELGGSARGVYSSLQKHIDPNLSFLISNRWNTDIGDVGALLDVSYNKLHYESQDLYNYLSYESVTVGDNTAYAPGTVGGSDALGARERASANLSLQWRPNQSLDFYGEIFYTRYRNPNSVDYLIGLPWISATAMTSTTDPDGGEEATSLTGTGYAMTSNQSYRDKTDTVQYSLGGSWVGENLMITSEFNYTWSQYSRTGIILDSQINDSNLVTTVNFNQSGKGSPNVTISGVDMLDPSNYTLRQFYDDWDKETGTDLSWKMDGTYTFDDGPFKSVAFGLRYNNRGGEARADAGTGHDCDGSDSVVLSSDACTAGYTLEDLAESIGVSGNAWSTSHGKIFKGDRKFGTRQWINANADWIYKHRSAIRALFGQSTDAPEALPTNSFNDREQSYAAYAQGNYDFYLFDINVSGNFGLRVVDTVSHMEGYDSNTVGDDTTYTQDVARKEVVDWMPSFNLKLGLKDNLDARIAVSRTVTRPTFAELNPGMSLSSSTGTTIGSGSAGNPDLAPMKSNNVDMSLEYYFGKQNMLSGSLFYHQIIGYVGYQSYDYTQDDITYTMSKPQNGGQGFLQGAEINYTQFFDFLPGYLSGLGLQMNGTYITGHEDTSKNDTSKINYTSVSKYSFNIIGMYEYGPVSLRTAYNWRSGYLVSSSASGGALTQPETIYATPYGELDFSASYKLPEEGLTFTVDATNMLNGIGADHYGKNHTWGRIYPRDTDRYDQTISIGVRYKY